MRVTDSFRARTVSTNLNRSRVRMTDLQEQLASGKRINKPSDDPTGMAVTMKLRTTLEGNEQFQSNISDSIAKLDAQESALNDVYSVLLELKEITTEGASDSVTVRDSLALQIEQMMENLVEIANTKDGGVYIFGGTETLNKPFLYNKNVLNDGIEGDMTTYLGNDEEINRQINENTRIAVNLDGNDVFKGVGPGSVDIFQMMYNIRNDLLAEDSHAISGQLDEVEKGIEQTLKNFLKVGTRKQLVVFNDDRFVSQNIQLRANMSQIEDVEYGDAFIQFKAEENALNSALSAGAKVISPSLLDFIS